jgi:hypothetical protein
MPHLLPSVFGSLVGKILPHRTYWAAKLSTGAWVCELDHRDDLSHGTRRSFDWSLDLVDTGDVLKITELWLFCPPSRLSPLGSTARLPITEPGTAFQFTFSRVDAFGAWGKTIQHRIIGRVIDKARGECEYVVYDGEVGGMSTPMTNNVYDFQGWREGIPRLGPLNVEVLGLRL